MKFEEVEKIVIFVVKSLMLRKHYFVLIKYPVSDLDEIGDYRLLSARIKKKTIKSLIMQSINNYRIGEMSRS